VSVPVNHTVNGYIDSRDEAEHRLNIDDMYRISRSARLFPYKGLEYQFHRKLFGLQSQSRCGS
jgi:hypothetical protein